MTAQTYRLAMRIVAVAIGAAIAVSVVAQLPLYVPMVAVMVAVVLSIVLRQSVKEIMTDERSRKIQERSTDLAYRIFTVLGAALAVTALMLRSYLPSWVFVAGQTIAYSVCGLMVLHLACARYFSSKL